MKKLLLILIIILVGCEKQYKDLIEESPQLNIYIDEVADNANISYNNITGVYRLNYPENITNSYFKIRYNTSSYQRVYWESPDMFYIIMWQDTIWTPIINFSTYADENGDGRQIAYINNTLVGDTLNIIGKTNNIEKEIKVYIVTYNPDHVGWLCDENGNYY